MREKEVVGTTECIRCGRTIDLTVEKYGEDDYSPVMAFHCGYLYAETDFDGRLEVFDLRKKPVRKPKPPKPMKDKTLLELIK